MRKTYNFKPLLIVQVIWFKRRLGHKWYIQYQSQYLLAGFNLKTYWQDSISNLLCDHKKLHTTELVDTPKSCFHKNIYTQNYEKNVMISIQHSCYNLPNLNILVSY